jgi:predicted Rdx family selenoprotein
VADLLKQELGIKEVALVSGERGEFSVWVAENLVARKDGLEFPDEQEVLKAVRDALDA